MKKRHFLKTTLMASLASLAFSQAAVAANPVKNRIRRCNLWPRCVMGYF